MDVGIGLPNTVPGTSGKQLVEWAKRAEQRGFSSLGTIDRIAYGNYEPLTTLAAAAAVTERIGLWTSVLLAPLRPNVAELAKRALSIQALSGGRLHLGLGIGGREDDFALSGVEMAGRGSWFDEALPRIREIWAGDEIGPATETPPKLIIGGGVDASFERAAKYGDGWIAGGSGPEEFIAAAGKVKEAWATQGRDGEPYLAGLAYFSLGDDGERNADEVLGDYYRWLGAETAGMIASSAAKDAETVQQYLGAYTEAGCDELILFPASNDPAQVDLLADAAGL